MADPWLTIIENQQQEIQELRQTLTSPSPGSTSSGLHVNECTLDGSTGSYGSPAKSSSSPSVSSQFSPPSSPPTAVVMGIMPLDADHYAKTCNKIERLQSKLIKKNVQVHKLRAKCAAANQQAEEAQQRAAEMVLQTYQLTEKVANSIRAKDEAIEKAAQALMQCDTLTAQVSRLKHDEQLLYVELRTRQENVVELQRSHERLHEETMQLRMDSMRVREENGQMRLENQRLLRQTQHAQQQIQHEDELIRQNAALHHRIAELENVMATQSEQLERQRQMIGKLEVVERELSHECAEDKRHSAHLLYTNINLQQLLENTQLQSHRRKEMCCELNETTLMVQEELHLMRQQCNCQVQLRHENEARYDALVKEHKQLIKKCTAMESSRRKVVAIFVQSRKRLLSLHRSLDRLQSELESVSQTISTSRSREVALGRALREYGKRNWSLQNAMCTIKQQNLSRPLLSLELRSVTENLRSSEKRRKREVTANWDLKRSLVQERCQRTDLLHHCAELKKCLVLCHNSSMETHKQAKLLDKENGILQHAVKQLVAFAQELVVSQDALQQELKRLEVHGQAEQFVYG